MEFLIIWLLFGLVAMIIASSKERDGCGWFLLGCLFGPFSLVVAALPPLKKDPNAPDPATHGKCPECAEVVLKEARVCKHCGANVNGGWRPIAPAVEQKKGMTPMESIIGIVIMVIIVAAVLIGIKP
jgi:hypothetical protein